MLQKLLCVRISCKSQKYLRINCVLVGSFKHVSAAPNWEHFSSLRHKVKLEFQSLILWTLWPSSWAVSDVQQQRKWEKENTGGLQEEGSWRTQFRRKKVQGGPQLICLEEHTLTPSHTLCLCFSLFLSDSGNICLLGCGFAHASLKALQAFCYACLFPNVSGAAGYKMPTCISDSLLENLCCGLVISYLFQLESHWWKTCILLETKVGPTFTGTMFKWGLSLVHVDNRRKSKGSLLFLLIQSTWQKFFFFFFFLSFQLSTWLVSFKKVTIPPLSLHSRHPYCSTHLPPQVIASLLHYLPLQTQAS